GVLFFFSSRRRHTRSKRDWSSDVCSSDLEQVAYAKSLGMTVLITDHHEIPYEEQADGSIRTFMPAADGVVNPKQEGCSYPFKGRSEERRVGNECRGGLRAECG